jgi:hypothetical protein
LRSFPFSFATRAPESDLQTTSEGPLVRSFGTFPSVWSGKYE